MRQSQGQSLRRRPRRQRDAALKAVANFVPRRETKPLMRRVGSGELVKIAEGMERPEAVSAWRTRESSYALSQQVSPAS